MCREDSEVEGDPGLADLMPVYIVIYGLRTDT